MLLLSAAFCACDRRLFLAATSACPCWCLPDDQRGKCHHAHLGTMVRVLSLRPTERAACSLAAVAVSGVVVAAADARTVSAAALRSAAAAAVPCVAAPAAAAAAAELAVAVSAVGSSEAGVLVVRGVAASAAAAEPQALPAASARGRCFAEGSALMSLARRQAFSCPVGNLR